MGHANDRTVPLQSGLYPAAFGRAPLPALLSPAIGCDSPRPPPWGCPLMVMVGLRLRKGHLWGSAWVAKCWCSCSPMCSCVVGCVLGCCFMLPLF